MEQPTEQQTMPSQASSENQQQNKPVKKYVTKGGISATIWSEIKEYEGKQVEYFNISVERQYTRDDGKNWESTNSMRPDDLPKVALVCEQAYKYINLKQLGN